MKVMFFIPDKCQRKIAESFLEQQDGSQNHVEILMRVSNRLINHMIIILNDLGRRKKTYISFAENIRTQQHFGSSGD